MPRCSLSLEGVAEEWSILPALISRLNQTHRLIVPSGTGDLNTCNADVAHNHLTLRPLLERMANEASWELFSMVEIKHQSLGTIHIGNRVLPFSALEPMPGFSYALQVESECSNRLFEPIQLHRLRVVRGNRIYLRLLKLHRALGLKVKKEYVHLDCLWAKSFTSFVKMKVRKGLPASATRLAR